MTFRKGHRGRRTVQAPPAEGGDAPGGVVGVELAEDEEVRWSWTHVAGGASFVTGYEIVKRDDQRSSEA